MKKDNSGKKIKRSTASVRCSTNDINYALENLEEWGFENMNDILENLFHDFCEKKRNPSIEDKEQKKSELMEKRKEIDDKLIKLTFEIEKQKEEEFLRNIENQSREGDNMELTQFDIEHSFPLIEKQINQTGMVDKVEKLIKEVKNNPEILNDDGRFELLKRELHEVKDGEGTPYFTHIIKDFKKYVKYKAGIE